MCERAIENEPYILKYVPDHFKTQEEPWSFKYIPDHLKTQKVCNKTFEKSLWQWKDIPDRF